MARAAAPAPVPASAATSGGWQPKILATGAPYLPDFSYAGYGEGEVALPALSPTHDITDFGAVPDDDKDDTEAFRRALAGLTHVDGPVVLSLKPGRYLLSDVLYVERADFVLRGAGSGTGGTVLELRRPLADLPPVPVIQELEAYLKKNDKRVNGQPFSAFSWTGGLIWTRLAKPSVPRAVGTALEGRRGQHYLKVSGPLPGAGSLVELSWFNRFGRDSPVLQQVFGLAGPIEGEKLADGARPLTSQTLRVVSAVGDELYVKQPLRHDVQPSWGAALSAAAERLTGVGFEHFRVELPDEPYAGHHLERGYNAFYLTDLRDGFMRDIAIDNSDSAILTDACDHLTLTGIRVSGRAGHYGIHLGDVEDVLVRDFLVDARREHSLSFNTGARGSVFSRGRILDPRLDQHRGRNHQNLFDAIAGVESGKRSLLFEHGGADYWGPTHGAFNTFWNIRLEMQSAERTSAPWRLSGVSDAGPARIVGLYANVPLVVDYPGAYTEGIGQSGIAVPSLYEAQLQRRLDAAQSGSVPNTSTPPR